jgi:hypothetical protein
MATSLHTMEEGLSGAHAPTIVAAPQPGAGARGARSIRSSFMYTTHQIPLGALSMTSPRHDSSVSLPRWYNHAAQACLLGYPERGNRSRVRVVSHTLVGGVHGGGADGPSTFLPCPSVGSGDHLRCVCTRQAFLHRMQRGCHRPASSSETPCGHKCPKPRWDGPRRMQRGYHPPARRTCRHVARWCPTPRLLRDRGRRRGCRRAAQRIYTVHS